RQIRLAAWLPGEEKRRDEAGRLPLRVPAADIHIVLPQSSVAVCELPQLAFDRAGRLWALFPRPTPRHPREDGWAAQGMWELYATTLEGDRWSIPFALPHSSGRNDMRADFTHDPGGRLWVTWATDHRTWQAPAPQDLAVQLAPLDGEG